MSALWKYRLLYIATIIVLFIVDQGTKIWAIQYLDHRNMSYLIIEPYLELRIVYNPGAAWGMLSGWTQGLAVMSTILIIVIITVLGKTSLKDRLLGWALTFQLGGAFGNLYDRVSNRPGVVDFINAYIPWGGGEDGIWDRFFGSIGLESAQQWAASQPPLYDYPVFNFADIWVVLGTIMLVTYIMLMPSDDQHDKRKKPSETETLYGDKLDEETDTVAVSIDTLNDDDEESPPSDELTDLQSDELEDEKRSDES